MIRQSAEFKSARRALGMTQLQAAKLFGVAPTTVRKWEAGDDCSTSTKVHPAAARFMEALAGGWRPSDWAEATAKAPRGKRAVKA